MVQTSFPSHGKIEVGGRNLLRNSDFSKGTSPWYGARGKIAVENKDGKQMMKFVSNEENLTHYATQSYGKGTFAVGETLTESVWVYTESPVQVSLFFTETYVGDFYDPFVEVSGWKRLVFAHTIQSDASQFWFNVRINDNNTNKTIWIYHPKLERGTIATDWTPAPEDILERLAALESKAGAAADEPGDDNEVI